MVSLDAAPPRRTGEAQVEHAAFGPVEEMPLPRIQKLVSATLSKNWTTIPHVTHHEDADISTLSAMREKLGAANELRPSVLAYTLKALVIVLRAYPRFNASLGSDGSSLILKKYYHVGIAVDTPNGLMVPVIRDVDRKDVMTITREIADLSSRARAKGLPLGDMQGGSFSVSSLGSIGGTGFTPIINAPEVAILGTSRSYEKPVRVDGELAWRTVLPLSLSYDHRVINGADAARFCVALGAALSMPEQLLGGM